MSANHMNLKRISHRIKEELGSTIEVAKVVGIKGAFATFRGKVDIQIMVHNGHIEYNYCFAWVHFSYRTSSTTQSAECLVD